jgi:glycosyltransferase involved in cell wall biosynthesis
MKSELSILIPVYNDVCASLVVELQRQAEAINGLSYEIIVADDGSTLLDCVEMNHNAFGSLPHCQFVIRKENVGRAAIRNYLARQARFRWLLFIDGDMTIISRQFLYYYLNSSGNQVVYGGYAVGKGEKSNLRYCYEKASEPFHKAERRRQQPYRDFHTSNFIIRRELMLEHPFDERFRHYGYEDVFFGKVLRQHHVQIQHIDNPVGFDVFESNKEFLRKTEEGTRTLHEFREELRGYNNLLTLVGGIHLEVVRMIIRLWHRLFGCLERRNLEGTHPSLTIFKLYKLGYYLTLTKND